MNVNLSRPQILPYEKLRVKAFNKIAFAHITDSTTKLSLQNGQVSRDITRDIRIFEFCFSSPIECSVNSDPATRRLVRSYLADKLPPEMTGEAWPRGRQSADWRERILPNWQRIYEDMQAVCGSKELSRFVDSAAVNAALERYRDAPAQEDEYKFMRFGAVYMLGLFLEAIK
jgi:asparagine synthase (glutamine-hydrolysing)